MTRGTVEHLVELLLEDRRAHEAEALQGRREERHERQLAEAAARMEKENQHEHESTVKTRV